MSRGVIYTATYRDFLEGVLLIDVPQGYNRIQFNQFTAGGVKEINGQIWGWLYKDEQANLQALTNSNMKLYATQRAPIDKTYAPAPEMSLILKVFCEGIDSQSPIVAATTVGDTVYLGMNGNPYKITNRTLKIYITNETDQLVNNFGIILQYTFI